MKKTLPYYLFVFLFLLPLLLQAHVPEQGYIYLRIYESDGIDGRFEMQAGDLNKIFNWNLLKKGNDTDAIMRHYDELTSYLLSHSAFSSANGIHNVKFKVCTPPNVLISTILLLTHKFKLCTPPNALTSSI